MEGEKVRILLIEDNPGDARLIRELLNAAEGASFDLEHVERLSTGLARLTRGGIDVILLDLSLPDSHGLDGLNKICAQTLKVPVVVLSGLSNEAVAVNAVHEGAQDYLVKGSVDSALLVRSLHYAIERQRLRVALRESEAHYRLLADNATDVIWTANMKWQITHVSPSIKRLLGYTVEEMKKLAIKDILTPDALKQAGKLIRNQMDIMNPGSQHPPMSLTLEHVRKDGSTLWAEVMLSFLWDKEGRLSEVLGVTRDITERKKAEEALRESQEELQAIFDSSMNGIALLDLEGKVIRVNKRVWEVGGYDTEDISGKPLDLLKMFTPESIERMSSVRDMILAGKEGTAFECELCTKSGTKMSLELNVGPFLLKGKLFGIVAVMRDITERKRMEDALRESEERHRLYFENASDVIYSVDPEGTILSMSPSVERSLGYKPEELIGKNMADLNIVPPEKLEQGLIDTMRALAGERIISSDSEFLAKDGSVKFGEISGAPIFSRDGKVIAAIFVARDITERKKAEESLRESERRLRDAMVLGNSGYWEFDIAAQKLIWAEPTFKLFGRDPSLGAPSVEEEAAYYPPEQVVKLREYAQRAIEKRESIEYDFVVTLPSGKSAYMMGFMRPVSDASGKVAKLFGAFHDITERKKMEEEVRLLSDAVRMSSESILVADLEGKVLDANNAAMRMFGADDISDLRGKGVAELIDVADQGKASGNMDRALREGELDVVEYSIVRKDGSKILTEISASTLKGSDGEPTGFVAVARDITERKRMEDALRQSEQDYRTLFDTTIDGMAVIDAETMRVLLINQPILQKYGSGLSEDIFKGNLLNFVHPEDREQALKLIVEDLFEKDARKFVKIRLINSDGKMFWASCTGARIRYQERPAGLISLRDITEQQEAEDALRDSEERFRRLSDQAPDIIFRFSNEKGLEYCSPIVFEITGYTAEELLAEPEIGIELAKGFDAGLAEDYETSVTKGVSMRTREISFVHKDGRKIYLDMRSHAVRDKEGNVIAYEGILRDITERKRMEEELHLLSDAVRMTAESVSIVDLTGRIVDINEAGLKMQGLKNKADLVGKNPFGIIIPEDRPKALENMKKILAEGSLQPVEYHILTNDGRKALIETSVSLIRGEEGEPKSLVAVARDITERRRIEEALRESEKRYRLLAENLRDVIWTVDMNWCLTYVSPSVTQLAGYSVEEYITKNWDEMVAPASVDLLMNIFTEELALEADGHSDLLRSRTFEVELKCKDGSTVPVEMKVTFLRGPDGRPTGILGVSRDITARKKAEEEKQKLEEQLQLAGRLAAVGELAAGVAHELNNPIAAIKGFAQFLTARKDLDVTIRKDLDTIFRESQRAAKITQNLLSFARRHEPEKHPVSINDVIENILEMQEHVMKVNNIELEVDLKPDLPKTMADFHQMQQVFMNIVNNAEQAMIEAHGKGRLLIKTQRSGKMVQITFADNGPGISEENLKRIFDPFFTTKEVGKGTGLGLSICYGLIESHGGRIYAKSKLGQGATFVVEMPIVSEKELVAEAALLNPGLRGVKWKKP